MIKNTITEITSFEIVNGINDQEFINIVDSLEKEFHMKQKGYIDTELIKGKDLKKNIDYWIMIQHWETKDDAKESSKQMMKNESTEKFRSLVDPKSVKLLYLELKRRWSKDNNNN